MREAAVWFLLACASAGLFAFVIEPWARGRLSTFEYHAYIRSPEWHAFLAHLALKRRGRRSAVSGATSGLQGHHWDYRNLGYEHTWQVVMVTDREHKRIHRLSEWLFSSRTRGLWFTTGAVCGAGKLKRLLGHRAPHEVISH